MGSRALTVANSRYDDGHFADLPAASADAAALAEVLGDPAIGGFEVNQLVDADQRTAMRALESFFTTAKPDDLLLLHLSLHGWKALRDRVVSGHSAHHVSCLDSEPLPRCGRSRNWALSAIT